MAPATLIPNIVSSMWQPAIFSSFSLLSRYVSANCLFSSQSHCFVTSFSRCILSPLLFHTSSSIKGPLLNRKCPRFSLWLLPPYFPDLVDSPAILPALLSLSWRKVKWKNLKIWVLKIYIYIWVLVLIHYPFKSFIYTAVFTHTHIHTVALGNSKNCQSIN